MPFTVPVTLPVTALVNAFAGDYSSAHAILTDGAKAETISWGRAKRTHFSALRRWIANTDPHPNTRKSSEDGSVIAEKSFCWSQALSSEHNNPDRNIKGSPPDNGLDNAPDTEHSKEKTYLLNADHLMHQMQKAQSQEDRNLICLQRTLEILVIAAVLLFFL